MGGVVFSYQCRSCMLESARSTCSLLDGMVEVSAAVSSRRPHTPPPNYQADYVDAPLPPSSAFACPRSISFLAAVGCEQQEKRETEERRTRFRQQVRETDRQTNGDMEKQTKIWKDRETQVVVTRRKGRKRCPAFATLRHVLTYHFLFSFSIDMSECFFAASPVRPPLDLEIRQFSAVHPTTVPVQYHNSKPFTTAGRPFGLIPP